MKAETMKSDFLPRLQNIYKLIYLQFTFSAWNPINPIAPFVARVASYVVSVFLTVGIVVGFVNCCKSGKTKRNLLKVEGALDTFAGICSTSMHESTLRNIMNLPENKLMALIRNSESLTKFSD